MASGPTVKNPMVAALENWRNLSEMEFSAIAAEDWLALARAQKDKSLLRERMEVLRASPSSSAMVAAPFPEPINSEFRRKVSELVAMEQRNLEFLSAKLESSRRARSELESSTRNLQNLRTSYGRRSEGFWQSYS